MTHSRNKGRTAERAALTLVLRELARTAGDKNAVRRRGWKVDRDRGLAVLGAHGAKREASYALRQARREAA